uniref:Uncharacterized protein n=1 Tax=viral metagenome TaxID=1070528 RepID=A0A6C0DDM7_9ZZZZ
MSPLGEIIALTILFLFLIIHGRVSGPKIYSFLLNHVIALLLAFSISYLYFNYKN